VDVGAAVCNIAIFLGVLAILSKFVWPEILGGLQAREDKIHGELKAAAQANTEAKTLLSEYQAKLDDAASQVQVMLADARKDGETSGQRIVDEAKSEAQRQRERAIADIETATKVALSELAGQTSDMAIHVAKQVVGRELKAEDHADLIRQSLDRLPSNN
jgi:F-type H+-transporting ATPase subunit b